MVDPVFSIIPLRECTAKVLAAAVVSLFPRAQVVGSGATDLGFYADFVFGQDASFDTLGSIEERMQELIRQDFPMKSMTMICGNAAELMRHHHQNLVEKQLLAHPTKQFIELVCIGEFYALCPLPHLSSTRGAKASALSSIEKKSVNHRILGVIEVVRVTGVVFSSNEELKLYRKNVKRVQQFEHRQLGQKLGWIRFEENLPIWLPKGRVLRDLLVQWWTKEHERLGYQVVTIPPGEEHLLENLARDEGKWASMGPVWRDVDDPQLAGLLRSSVFWQDCAIERVYSKDLASSVNSSLHLLQKFIKIFGFEGCWVLQNRGNPPKRQVAHWKRSSGILRKALQEQAILFQEEAALFEIDGPQISVRINDRLCRTLQVAFLRLDLSDAKGPLLKRSLFSSLERLIALLIEKHEGRLPVWLAPEQVRILVVSNDQRQYACDLKDRCESWGLRVVVDQTDNRLSKKIFFLRESAVPYGLIIGSEEERNKTVSVCYPDGSEKKGVAVKEIQKVLSQGSQWPHLNRESKV